MSNIVSTGVRTLVIAASAAALASVAQAQSPQLSSLHDALHLAPQQEDGWRAYVAAISPDPVADARHRETARLAPTLPTPRRVDLINAEIDEDAAMIHRQGAAVKAFYAGLSPSQQRTFDRQTSAQGGGAQGGGGPDDGGAGRLGRPAGDGLPPPR